ncbi:hypothetical protein PHMEG_00028393, partial [Phytophthora megakarya]
RVDGPQPQRSCFKCSDLTHLVFQCPQVKDYAEEKVLYETKTGRKARTDKSESSVYVAQVKLVTDPGNKRTLPCRVMDCVDTSIKPDSGAEESLIAPCLVEMLQSKQVWLPRRDLPRTRVVRGIGAVRNIISEETNLSSRFETPCGPLVLRDVVCLLSPVPLPSGVGDILLSDAEMEHLGYDSHKLIESDQSVQSDYDLGGIGVHVSISGVLAFHVHKQ